MRKLFVLFAVIMFACQPGGGPITQADKDAIKQNIDTFAEAVRSNPANVGNSYADDIITMPPHDKEVSGKANAVAFHSEPGPAITSFTLNTAEIDGEGKLAYARGTWTFSGTVNDTIAVSDNGKWLIILRKQADNSWKTVRETWNSDQPMPGM